MSLLSYKEAGSPFSRRRKGDAGWGAGTPLVVGLTKESAALVGSDPAVLRSFFKEAMTAPSLKSFKSLLSSSSKAVKPSIPGKLTSTAKTTGSGFAGVLGKSGISAHPTPAPPRVIS